ncbi:MAG: RNA polymerase [Monoraphidium minutum]|nr:MAG: RNA polymerase [Monoraphidium minutum]
MDQTTRLYQIRRTCLEMLADRDYLVGEDDLGMTFDQFRERFGALGSVSKDQLTLLQQHRDDPSQKIVVFFPDASKVGVKEIKDMSEKMKEEAVHRAILVVAQNLTPFARSVVADMQGKQVMEVFTEAELLVNITKHTLVPSHRILSPEEKATLLARYKVKEAQLPRIQLSDPVARYYGLQRGQVVRIVRSSETAGRYVTYRWCV